MAEFRFSVCSELFTTISDMNFDDTIRVIRSLDADVELAPFTDYKPVTKIPRQVVERRRNFLQNLGVRVSGVHWILAGGNKVFNEEWEIPGGPHITADNTFVRLRTADYAAKVFEYVTYLRGAGNINTDNPLVGVWGSPSQRNLQKGMSFKKGSENASLIFADILTRGGHSVTIALERLVNNELSDGSPNPNGETNFCHNMYQVNKVVMLTRRKLKEDKHLMRSMLDVKACVLSDDDPLKVLKNPHMVYHVHVQDPYSLGPPGWNKEGVFLGEGHYDFKPLMRRLVDINLDGNYVCVSMEPFKPFFDNLPQSHRAIITPEVVFRESLGYLREIVSRYQASR